MRTKTTILSAVALAAGLLSASAQVYSANVVGYYNVVTPALKYSHISNQLTNNGNNINLHLTSGMVSDPDGNLNTVLFIWNGAATPGYSVFQYFTDADAANNFGTGFGDGWYNGGGARPATVLSEGVAAFVYNPSASSITNTIVGQVVQGSSSQSILAGFNALALKPAIATNLVNALVNFPGTSDPDGNNNDVYYHWTGTTYDVLTYFTGPDAANNFGNDFGNGFYDGGGANKNSDATKWPKVGQGFFLFHVGASATWNYSFTVQ